MKKRNLLFFLSLIGMLASCGGTSSSATTAAPTGPTTETTSTSVTTVETTETTSQPTATTSETTSAHTEHEFIFDHHVDPTADEQGYDVFKCKDCNETEKRNFTGLIGELDFADSFSVLFIGNSYTMNNTLWEVFSDISTDQGVDVEVDRVVNGGWTLQQMADPTDNFGSQVYQKLDENEYDVVFMQEQSLRPATQPAFFFDAVRKINPLILENGAQPVLYETWGRKSTSPDLVTYNMTNYTMTQKLMASYGAIGEELGIPVSHAGQAFYEVYSQHPEIELYDLDMYHPTRIGTYLVGLVHYATVFGLSPIGVENKYFKSETDSWKQDILETAAYNAVFGESILEESYKTSSVGVTTEIQEQDLEIEVPEKLPESKIDVVYKINNGDWKVEKDETSGSVVMTSVGTKGTLMFDNELFSNGGEISFTMTADGLFGGASEQGLIFGAKDSNIIYTDPADIYQILGRAKEGNPEHTIIDKTVISNYIAYVQPENAPIMPANTPTRITIKADFAHNVFKMYYGKDLTQVSYAPYDIHGGYIGFTSGISGSISVKDVVVNGKLLNIINYVNEPADKSFTLHNLEVALHAKENEHFEWDVDTNCYKIFISTPFVKGQEIRALNTYVSLLKYYMTPITEVELIDESYGYTWLTSERGDNMAGYSFAGTGDKLTVEFDLYEKTNYGSLETPLSVTQAIDLTNYELNAKGYTKTYETLYVYGTVSSFGEKGDESGRVFYKNVEISDDTNKVVVPNLYFSPLQEATTINNGDTIVVKAFGQNVNNVINLVGDETNEAEVVTPVQLGITLGYINVSQMGFNDKYTFKQLSNDYFTNVEFYKHEGKTYGYVWEAMKCTIKDYAEDFRITKDVEVSTDGLTWQLLSDVTDEPVLGNVMFSIGRYRIVGNASNGNGSFGNGSKVFINQDNTFTLESTGPESGDRTWAALTFDKENGTPYSHRLVTMTYDMVIAPNGNGNTQWSVQVANQIAGQRANYIWNGEADEEGNATIYYKQTNGGYVSDISGLQSFKMKVDENGNLKFRLVVFSNQLATAEVVQSKQGIIDWDIYEYGQTVTADSTPINHVRKTLNGFTSIPSYVNFAPEVVNAKLTIKIVSVVEQTPVN